MHGMFNACIEGPLPLGTGKGTWSQGRGEGSLSLQDMLASGFAVAFVPHPAAAETSFLPNESWSHPWFHQVGSLINSYNNVRLATILCLPVALRFVQAHQPAQLPRQNGEGWVMGARSAGTCSCPGLSWVSPVNGSSSRFESLWDSGAIRCKFVWLQGGQDP